VLRAVDLTELGVEPTLETRELIQTALLIALCAAVGYIMMSVPNVELISAAIFTGGLLVGARRGALIGGMAEAIYAGLNPNGVSAPPLFVAQVLGMTLIGFTGGALSGRFESLGRGVQIGAAACAGLLLTLVYDVLTNSALYVSLRETTTWAALILGGLTFPFPFAHALGNTIAFALVSPAVVAAIRRRGAT